MYTRILQPEFRTACKHFVKAELKAYLQYKLACHLQSPKWGAEYGVYMCQLYTRGILLSKLHVHSCKMLLGEIHLDSA